jgi:hypothetical protein
MPIATVTELAELFGVSRQAVNQAMARSVSPPKVIGHAGEMRLYDRDEAAEWWQHRLDDRIKERRIRPLPGPSAQMNVRVTADEWAFMKSLREPGESMSSVGRRLLLEAIAARQAVSPDER